MHLRYTAVPAIVKPLLDTLRLPFSWLVRQEAVVLFTAFWVVLALVGFLELSEEIREGEIRHFDESVLRVVRRPNDPTRLIGLPWLSEAVTDITAPSGGTGCGCSPYPRARRPASTPSSVKSGTITR
jgi:hypothetical protein